MRFGDLGDIYDGPHATPQRLTEGHCYFLNISSLDNGRLDLSESDFISFEDHQKWTRRVEPRLNDLLFSYETRLGQAALMPDGIRASLGRRMALLRPDTSIVEPRFLLYWYLGPQMQALIERQMVMGATVPRILLSDLASWRISIPPLREQQAIVEVLGALDDKIAANSGLCHRMHDLGRAIFDRAAIGRPLVGLDSIADPCLGGTPTRGRSEYWGGSIPWVSIRDISSADVGTIVDTAESISVRGSENSRARVVPKGSVILSSRGTVGLVSRITMPAAFNQSCYAFRPNPIPPGVLYYSICRGAEASGGVAHGSVFSTITMKSMVDLKAPQFLQSEAQALECRIAPLLDAVESLLRESHSLAKLRDTLLPALMDGTLRVKDAVTHVEEVL